MDLAGIKEIARHADVSIATVSHVLNRTKSVSPELTKRVCDAIDELGYDVNVFARGLRGKSTKNIGVILPRITMMYFPEILQGIEDVASKNGYKIMYFNSNYDFELEKSYIKMLKSNWVDGIIVDSCCHDNSSREYVDILSCDNNPNKRVPVVVFDSQLALNTLSSICIDNYKCAQMAANHLIELGHKKIAFIGGPEHLSICKDNYAGFKDALQDAHIKLDKSLVASGDYIALSGYECAKKLINGNNFSALFACNDQMAIGAMKAIMEAGYSVPDDVAVIGLDNIFVGTLIEPSLSTINVPRYKMGAESVYLLIEHIKNPDFKAKNITLDCNLIVRKSTVKTSSYGWELYGW